MERIPITFTFQGLEYNGHFTAVYGAGNHIWHLMVNHFYWGQLGWTPLYGWSFGGNKGPALDAMAEEFGEHLMVWYQ